MLLVIILIQHFFEALFDSEKGWNLSPFAADSSRSFFNEFIVSEYGNQGEAIKGQFSSKMLNFGNGSNIPDTVDVNGSFDIIR